LQETLATRFLRVLTCRILTLGLGDAFGFFVSQGLLAAAGVDLKA
jgi:hypothetical protein